MSEQPLVDPGDDPIDVEGLRERLQAIAETIQDFAQLRFSSSAPIGPNGDIVDAVAAGVNFLGEELQASFSEIEKRVEERTEALEKATAELSHRVMHDELTGLANRGLLADRLTHRIQMTDRRARFFAVLYIDLDNFKAVNDSLGHHAGDELLVEIASRILATIRTSDTAARVGGDEFVLLLDEVDSPEAAVAMARRLNQAISEPFSIDRHRVRTTASIGIVLGIGRSKSTEALIRTADLTMYVVKGRGGNDVALDQDDLSQLA